LRSLPDAAVRLVYDAESGDGTLEVARALGATVVSRPWLGFARARVDAAEMVSTPWTFMVDADERLTAELRAEIAALEPPADVLAYSVARMNFFCGRWVRGAGWWPDRLVRLFRTGHAVIDARNAGSMQSVHETWHVAGRCAPLQAPLEHHSYPTIRSYREKFARYTALEAKGLRGRSRFDTFVGAWLAVPLKALWLLIGRRGILDGWRGVYICVASACYPAAVRWKARTY
jgi:glycosyltransferase involved in cell wall biosynthesis